jgi:hypothetical protein
MRNYCLIEFVKQSTWRVFEAIDRFLEMTHTLPLGLKPRWLSHIISLSKITMQECIFDIELVKWPIKISSQKDNNTDRIQLGNRGKSLSVIKAICLSETLGHKMSLQTINSTIRILFNGKNPTTNNNRGSCRFGN